MSNGKNILLFLIKSLSFSLIFCFIWIFLIERISANKLEKNTLTSSYNTDKLNKIYEQQLKKVDEQLISADMQQKRMQILIEKYENHVQRYEKVLQKWEKQTGIEK